MAASLLMCLLVGAPAAALEPTEAAEARQTGVLRSIDNEALTLTWSEVRAQLERGAWSEATSRVKKLVELRTDLGLSLIHI